MVYVTVIEPNHEAHYKNGQISTQLNSIEQKKLDEAIEKIKAALDR